MSSGYKMDSGEGFVHEQGDRYWWCKAPDGTTMWYIANEGIDRNCANIFMAGMQRGYDQGYAEKQAEISRCLGSNKSYEHLLNPVFPARRLP